MLQETSSHEVEDTPERPHSTVDKNRNDDEKVQGVARQLFPVTTAND